MASRSISFVRLWASLQLILLDVISGDFVGGIANSSFSSCEPLFAHVLHSEETHWSYKARDDPKRSPEKCWIIEIEDGEINVRFTDVNLGDCQENYITVYDGFHNLVRQVCAGIDSCDMIHTSSRIIFMKLFTAHSAVDSRFDYLICNSNKIPQECKENVSCCSTKQIVLFTFLILGVVTIFFCTFNNKAWPRTMQCYKTTTGKCSGWMELRLRRFGRRLRRHLPGGTNDTVGDSIQQQQQQQPDILNHERNPAPLARLPAAATHGGGNSRLLAERIQNSMMGTATTQVIHPQNGTRGPSSSFLLQRRHSHDSTLTAARIRSNNNTATITTTATAETTVQNRTTGASSLLQRRHSCDSAFSPAGSSLVATAVSSSIVTETGNCHSNPIRQNLSLIDWDNPNLNLNPDRSHENHTCSVTVDDASAMVNQLTNDVTYLRVQLPSNGQSNNNDPSLPTYTSVVDRGPPPAYETLGFS